MVAGCGQAYAGRMVALRNSGRRPRSATGREPWAARPGSPLRGALWMVAAAACFSVMITLVRHLTAGQHVFEIVFFRNFFGLLVMLPWLLRHGGSVLGTRRLGLHLLRASFGLSAMSLWFWVLSVLPLAEATALSFTAPIFATLLAVPFLGEPLSRRRVLAIFGAFLGALVILRPGARVLDPAALVALLTALVWGASTVLVKLLGRTEAPAAIVTWMVLLLTPLSGLLALPVWRTPEPAEWLFFVLLGLVGSSGHYCMSRALNSADAGHVLPFDYLRLPFVALLAWLVYRQPLDLWTGVGAALIAASSIWGTRARGRGGGRGRVAASGRSGVAAASVPVLGQPAADPVMRRYGSVILLLFALSAIAMAAAGYIFWILP